VLAFWDIRFNCPNGTWYYLCWQFDDQIFDALRKKDLESVLLRYLEAAFDKPLRPFLQRFFSGLPGVTD